MATERIDIRIGESGSRVVKRSFEDISGAAAKSSNAVDILKRALGGLTAFLSIQKVLEYADAYTTLQNRLRSVGLEGNTLSAVYDKLLKTSNETRASLEGSIELYSRLALSAKGLGVSQNDLLGFTKSLNQAITLSGASGIEAKAGLIQLSQGLASGVLRGDELRSVLEQLPAVADVIAKGLGVTRGELRKMGEEGKITAKVVLDAFAQARVELEERFAKTVPTISQSFEVLRNNVIDLVGRIDKELGASDKLSKFILTIAQNIDAVTTAAGKAIATLATLYASLLVFRGVAAISAAFALLGTTVGGVGVAVRAFFLLLNTSPVGVLLTALTAVVGLLAIFGNDINAGVDDLTTLGDVARAFSETAVEAFHAAYGAASEFFGGLYDTASTALAAVGVVIAPAVDGYLEKFNGFFDGVGTGWSAVLRGTARVVDAIAGLITGLVVGIVRAFTGLPAVIEAAFKTMANKVIDVSETMLNGIIEGVNKVRSFVGASLFETISFTRLEVDQKVFEQYGESIAGSIARGFEIQDGFAEKFVTAQLDRAKELAGAREEARRIADRPPLMQPDLNARTPAAALKGADDKGKLLKELKGLIAQLDPVAGALMAVAEATEILRKAREKGLITGDQEAGLLRRLNTAYEDAIDPLGALNREYNDQAKLLGLSAREREVEAEAMRQTQQLQRNGVDLSKQEGAALREKIAGLQRLAEVTAAADQLRPTSSEEQLRSLQVQIEAIKQLQASGEFSGADATRAAVATAPDLFEGTQAQLDANVAAWQVMYAQIDALQAANLITHQDAEQARSKITLEENKQRLAFQGQFFGTLAQLQSSGSKKLAAIGKAAAVAQATIDGILAVQKALASAPPPYNYALAAAVGVVAAANVKNIMDQGKGYMLGGYTGDGATNAPAGIVHGKEFVTNARATARNRPLLEAMNRGATIGDGGGVKVTFIDQTRGGVAVETSQISPSEIRMIARDEAESVVGKRVPRIVAAELSDPNSRVSKAVTNNTSAQRKRP